MNFFGTLGSGDILASVSSGVQNTGANLWPLLVLVGIPLAFVIGGMVISFIRKSVGGGTESKYFKYVEGEGMVAIEDQKLGEMEHSIETKGMWP